MRAFSYVCSLPVTWQDRHSICHSEKLLLYVNFMVEPELLPMEIAHADFLLFCFCDLDFYFDPTLLCWLDPYSLEAYRMCKYELPTSRLSKDIVWKTDRHEWNYIPHCRLVTTGLGLVYVQWFILAWEMSMCVVAITCWPRRQPVCPQQWGSNTNFHNSINIRYFFKVSAM